MTGFTLGREADVMVNDKYASLVHARISKNWENRWVVEDMGSVNGTYLNGVRVISSPSTAATLSATVSCCTTMRTSHRPCRCASGVTRSRLSELTRWSARTKRLA